MAWITRQWGTLSATALAVAMIGGAYLLASGAFRPHPTNAATTQALLQSIANRDSDHDGLPDWEEALYGTDPHNPDTFNLGMTDGEAVAKGLIVPKLSAPVLAATATSTATSSASTAADPLGGVTPESGSLTDLFAQNFFARYLTEKELNGGQPLTSTQISAIGQSAVSQILNQPTATAGYRTASQITVSGSGPAALRAYAAAVQQAFSRNTISENKTELEYLQEALSSATDTTALAHIRNIAGLYQAAAESLAQLPVPQEAATAHLELINAYARLAQDTRGFAQLDTDPLTTMLSLGSYQKDVLSVTHAYEDLHAAFVNAGVTLTPSDPGYEFVNVATSTPQ